jgi:hypothetical protein
MLSRLSIIIQSVVIIIMGFIILMSAPTITNAQATANESLAGIETICQGRLLIYIPSSQQELSEHQCLYFNSYMNLGGSVTGCYNAAREINCDTYNSTRYNCPPVLLDSE